MALQYRAIEAAQLLGDDSIGPLVASQDDFTIDFEGAVFTIIPAALIIVLTPFFLRNAFRKAEYMQSGMLLWFKMISAICLVGCEGANIVLWNVLPIFRSHTSLAASILACAGSVCVAVVLYAEHMYSYRPSTFLSVYMSITLMFDVAKIRSYFIRDGMEPIAGLAIVTLVLKFAIVVLEEVSKRHLVDSKRLEAPLSKESVSGFWNRSFFLWLNSTMRLGFKNILKVENLPILGPEFDSQDLHTRFRKHWTTGSYSPCAIVAVAANREPSRPNFKAFACHGPVQNAVLGVFFCHFPEVVSLCPLSKPTNPLSSHNLWC